MFLNCIQRHLAVCSMKELPSVAQRDSDFWHSISIMEPWRRLAPVQHLRDVLSLRFDDAENIDAEEGGITFVTSEHIQLALDFVDDRPGQPLLVQCWAGLSRSAAIALGLICRGLHQAGNTDFAEEAVDLLLQIRPQACPNVLVLHLMLETFLDPAQANKKTVEIVNHPELLANRFPRH